MQSASDTKIRSTINARPFLDVLIAFVGRRLAHPEEGAGNPASAARSPFDPGRSPSLHAVVDAADMPTLNLCGTGLP